MKTYIILLRGVMPYGKNKVPMAKLRDILEKAKFFSVRTYIQSGNVLLKTDLPTDEIEQKIHNLIKKYIGADLVVIAKTGRQLQKILNSNPIKKKDMSRVFYTMFTKKPSSQKLKKLSDMGFSSDKLAIKGLAAYMFIPGKAAPSKLNNNFLERKLEISATTRNVNTMNRLIEMSKEKKDSLDKL